MFRDEAEGLSARRQKLKDTASQKSTTTHIDAATRKSPTCKDIILSDSTSPSTSPVAIPVLSINPAFSAEEQATCYFFQNYIVGEDSYSTGSFEFLPNLYLSTEIDSALCDSLAAMGLVGLGHFYKAPSLTQSATFR